MSFENAVHVEGYIYDINLNMRTSGPDSSKPGTPFINGSIDVATDDDCLNVVRVSFAYMTEFYAKSGKENQTFKLLSKIAADGKSVKNVGIDKAMKVRVDGSIAVVDYLNRENKMTSFQEMQGSFVHEVTGALPADENSRNQFTADTILTNVGFNESETVYSLKGYVLDFRNSLIPVTFTLSNPRGQQAFEKLNIGPENPMVVNLWGNIINTTIQSEASVEEDDFDDWGVAKVETTTTTLRTWQVIGAKTSAAVPVEDKIDENHFHQMLAARKEYVATRKQRQEEYRASKNAPATTATSKTVISKGYDF